jgi:hypothetical protein
LRPSLWVETIRSIGDNTGSMALKGANPQHDGRSARTAGRCIAPGISSGVLPVAGSENIVSALASV